MLGVQLSFSIFAIFLVFCIVKCICASKLTSSPLRNMAGPKPRDWLTGSYAETGQCIEEQWIRQFGPTMKISGFFGTASVYTIDTKAVHHVLFNNQIYRKTTPARYFLERMTGNPGLTSAEGTVHRNQRKIMAPAFGWPQVRDLTHIFIRKSQQLRDIFTVEISRNGGVARLDMSTWLHKVTLDIIGLAGFSRDINATGTKPGDPQDEILTTFEKLLAVELGPLDFLQGTYPILRNVSTRNERMRAGSRAEMSRIGMKILDDSKRDIAESSAFETNRARDLLSLLVRANTSKEIPEHQRMSDEDVLAQIITFLVAGHVTTSTTVTWTLFALSQNMDSQNRLRAELGSLATDSPTMDQLNELSYLDCVVREGLRVHGPVPHNVREAFCDDLLPLKTPWTDETGNLHHSVPIVKGTEVFIPMSMINLDPSIWGPDAKEFRPERWEKPIENDIPGVWGQVISFIGGPRGCIGYRFSLVEIKSLLFTLIRNFEFQLAVPAEDVGKKIVRVTAGPTLFSEPEAGVQLPMLVRPVTQA